MGSAAPAVVTAATAEYLAAQDTVRNWVAECTEETAYALEAQSSTVFTVVEAMVRGER